VEAGNGAYGRVAEIAHLAAGSGRRVKEGVDEMLQ
jgi:hypothetical protein